MENFAALLIPALGAVLLMRLLILPLGRGLRFLLHGASGLVCLWLLNSVSGFTGLSFPVNAATVLIAGFLGLPGVGLMAVLNYLQ